MATELEVRIPRPTNCQEVERGITDVFRSLFREDEANLLCFEYDPNAGLMDMTIRHKEAIVSMEFYEFTSGAHAEDGLWCTLSANLNRSLPTFALVAVAAMAIASMFESDIVDDSLWLRKTRFVSPVTVKGLVDNIDNHDLVSFATFADEFCRANKLGA
ncbi:hypothetical protein [uncultured Gimesia sp.]|jgi:hypothetical protein|uniref:hypothetical protein n=1 Tax=uncultured Gimesia sp. TaxID=1678688 RepID=UPI002609B28E|nr:hypothetical protein [uncultured Gimesia sp.]